MVVNTLSGKHFLISIQIHNLQSFIYSDLNELSQIKEIKDKIHEITQIPHDTIEIRFGFPPKVLVASDDTTLQTSGIKSGGKFLIINLLTYFGSKKKKCKFIISRNSNS